MLQPNLKFSLSIEIANKLNTYTNTIFNSSSSNHCCLAQSAKYLLQLINEQLLTLRAKTETQHTHTHKQIKTSKQSRINHEKRYLME